MTREEVWQNVSQIVAEYPLLKCDRSLAKINFDLDALQIMFI